MKPMKHLVLIDFGTEGWRFEDPQFDTIDEAVKYAAKVARGNNFLIVLVVDWKAVAV